MSVYGTYDVVASYTSGGVTKSATYSLTVNKIWESIWKGTEQFDVDVSREEYLLTFPSDQFSSDESRNRQMRIS